MVLGFILLNIYCKSDPISIKDSDSCLVLYSKLVKGNWNCGSVVLHRENLNHLGLGVLVGGVVSV